MSIRDYLKFLPDSFNKKPESNIGKLFQIIRNQIGELNETLVRTEEWRSVDEAKGTTLDLLGDNVNEMRGTAKDDLFRIFIRAKVFRSRCDGTVNQIIKALSSTLNCKTTDIRIENIVRDDQGIRHPATIGINTIPEDRLSGVRLSVSQFIRLVDEVVAAGISVHYDLESSILPKQLFVANIMTTDYSHVDIPSEKRR